MLQEEDAKAQELERDIKEHIETPYYDAKVFRYSEANLPVCPVPVERGSYTEDEERSNTLLVQEDLKPVPLLIPIDIICDGLHCPIRPIEGQLTNPDPDLRSAILQEFLPIIPFIETLIRDTENGTSVEGILLGILLPEIIAYLLEFCYGRWSNRRKAENDRNEAPAGRESEGPQSPAQTHDNMEEEAELKVKGGA